MARKRDAALMLGVSGMRGIVGESLTPERVMRVAAVVGRRWREALDRAPTVTLARDSRTTGSMLAAAAAAGLAGVGCRVIHLGVVSTPTAALATAAGEADGGLIITASHNPAPWNGVKVLTAEGLAPPPDVAAAVVAEFRELDGGEAIPAWLDHEGMIEPEDDRDAADRHVRVVVDRVDREAIAHAGLTACVDSVHGAGGDAAAALLEALGVRCVHLYREPTGRFPHPPEPVASHLTELCQRVAAEGADVGFAQDPDADRLAIVDDHGRYIGEEYTLVLCAMQVLDRHAGHGGAGASLAANLSTSRMLDDVATARGATVHRTPVGEANVADAMQSRGCVAGGEGNGGIIWPEVGMVRDSLAGMALMLERIAITARPVSASVAETPAYAIVKDKLPRGETPLESLAERIASSFDADRVDTQDGVRLDWADRWIHVRPSNTEPIVRVIAEAPEAVDAEKLVATARGALGG